MSSTPGTLFRVCLRCNGAHLQLKAGLQGGPGPQRSQEDEAAVQGHFLVVLEDYGGLHEHSVEERSL